MLTGHELSEMAYGVDFDRSRRGKEADSPIGRLLCFQSPAVRLLSRPAGTLSSTGGGEGWVEGARPGCLKPCFPGWGQLVPRRGVLGLTGTSCPRPGSGRATNWSLRQPWGAVHGERLQDYRIAPGDHEPIFAGTSSASPHSYWLGRRGTPHSERVGSLRELPWAIRQRTAELNSFEILMPVAPWLVK